MKELDAMIRAKEVVFLPLGAEKEATEALIAKFKPTPDERVEMEDTVFWMREFETDKYWHETASSLEYLVKQHGGNYPVAQNCVNDYRDHGVPAGSAHVDNPGKDHKTAAYNILWHFYFRLFPESSVPTGGSTADFIEGQKALFKVREVAFKHISAYWDRVEKAFIEAGGYKRFKKRHIWHRAGSTVRPTLWLHELNEFERVRAAGIDEINAIAEYYSKRKGLKRALAALYKELGLDKQG